MIGNGQGPRTIEGTLSGGRCGVDDELVQPLKYEIK
jgi:hypothetical protein